MQLIFFGGGRFAAATLPLLATVHEIIQVVTPPPAAAGRKMQLTPTPVALVAETLRLPQVHAATPPALATAQGMIVCDYGKMLSPALLAATRLALNIHPSLLPKWRGAAPIERAILAGDSMTGVSIMQLSARLDAGAVLAQWQMPLTPAATAPLLYQQLAEQGAALLLRVLAQPADYPPQPQDERQASYAHKITAQCRHLDFNRGAHFCRRQVLAFMPPLGAGAYFFLRQGNASAGERVRVLAAQVQPLHGAAVTAPVGTLRVSDDDQQLSIVCAGGAVLCIDQLQRAGRKPVSATDFLRGWRQRQGAIAE